MEDGKDPRISRFFSTAQAGTQAQPQEDHDPLRVGLAVQLAPPGRAGNESGCTEVDGRRNQTDSGQDRDLGGHVLCLGTMASLWHPRDEDGTETCLSGASSQAGCAVTAGTQNAQSVPTAVRVPAGTGRRSG